MTRIVLIEDEPLVRNVFLAALRLFGFEVQVSGACVQPKDVDACELECCAGDGTPDLAVIAVIAPRLCSGLEAAQKALALWPAVKILLTSASPMQLWPESAQRLLHNLPRDSYLFLPKPFTVSQLSTTVERLLRRDLDRP
jgi:CheY-like chemotaxis protein